MAVVIVLSQINWLYSTTNNKRSGNEHLKPYQGVAKENKQTNLLDIRCFAFYDLLAEIVPILATFNHHTLE